MEGVVIVLALRDYLSGLTDDDGATLCEVTARDRTTPGSPDPMLSTIDSSDFDELWLFAVDTGDGLDPEDCAAIGRFREKGRGLLVTRDHMDLGSSVCTLAASVPRTSSTARIPSQTRGTGSSTIARQTISSGRIIIPARTAIFRKSTSSATPIRCCVIPRPPAA